LVRPLAALLHKFSKSRLSSRLPEWSGVIGNGAWASTPSKSAPSAKRLSRHAIVLCTVTTPRGRGSTLVPEALGWRSPSAGKSTDAKAQPHGYARAAPTRERRAPRLARTAIARRAPQPRPARAGDFQAAALCQRCRDGHCGATLLSASDDRAHDLCASRAPED
jgi:hypothetical protein